MLVVSILITFEVVMECSGFIVRATGDVDLHSESISTAHAVLRHQSILIELPYVAKLRASRPPIDNAWKIEVRLGLQYQSHFHNPQEY